MFVVKVRYLYPLGSENGEADQEVARRKFSNTMLIMVKKNTISTKVTTAKGQFDKEQNAPFPLPCPVPLETTYSQQSKDQRGHYDRYARACYGRGATTARRVTWWC